MRIDALVWMSELNTEDLVTQISYSNHKSDCSWFCTGKQSLTRLATFAASSLHHALTCSVCASHRQFQGEMQFEAGYKLFEITLSRGYGDDQLREDLKVSQTAWCRAARLCDFRESSLHCRPYTLPPSNSPWASSSQMSLRDHSVVG